MSNYKFIHTNVEHHQDYKVTVEVGGEPGLSDLLMEIEHFIRACGFCPRGSLEFVEEE